MTERGRVIAVGDLNGAYDVLVDILRATGLVNRKLAWVGKQAELVQVGDLFNRGAGAARALRLLLRLQRQAPRTGGKVTVLLGNHEVMTALRHEGYCTEDEYLSFASAAAQRAWPARVQRMMLRLARDRSQGTVLPIAPRLAAWKIEHVPGRAELRRALSARGSLGRALRRLPVVYRTGRTLFVHAGLLPAWARLGIGALNQRARADWANARVTLWSLPKHSLFRSSTGPLWDRSLMRGGRQMLAQLRETLELTESERMVVGHTTTGSLVGGQAGRIAVQAGGRLIGIDVGLCSGNSTPRAALIIDRGRGYQWTPEGTSLLWERAPRR